MNKLILVGIILVSIAVIGFTAGTLGLTSDVRIIEVTTTQKGVGEPIIIAMPIETKDLSDTKITVTKTSEVTITAEDWVNCQVQLGMNEKQCGEYFRLSNSKYLAQQAVSEDQAIQEAKAKESVIPSLKDFTVENLTVTQKDVEDQINVMTATATVSQ